MNEYEAIFGEVRDVADLRRAIARAVRTLRAAMEKEDNVAVTAAHVRNLEELEPEALALAYATAEQRCTFWPSPGQIRELAGWSEETRARAALGWVFRYLEMHGVDGRARGGGVRFAEDETGARVLMETSPVVAAPALPAEIARTLTLLTCGQVKDGLRYLRQHPVIQGWEGFSGDSGIRTAERIETQWLRCYRQMTRTVNTPPVYGDRYEPGNAAD
jgi:hypothetical protein